MSKRSASKAKDEGKVSPEEATKTGSQTTAVENEGAGDAGPVADSGVSETEELPELSKEDQQAAVAGSMGGTDNYPYQDRTAAPVHERTTPGMGNSPLDEASQAELNPAFTAKAEDGGPVNANDESIGTEPNVNDQALAAAENSGQDGAVEAVEESIAEGEKQQMDAEAVTNAAQERKESGDEPTPAGAPSGMEPSSDGEAGTAGAKDEEK